MEEKKVFVVMERFTRGHASQGVSAIFATHEAALKYAQEVEEKDKECEASIHVTPFFDL